MNAPPQLLDTAAQPPAEANRRVLRRLFLTLFLRGRSSRGLRKATAPTTVGSKLALTLLFYGALGLMACIFLGRPLFPLAVYLHAMTLVFLGMFVAASAGEVLFNKEEGDILLHRPVDPRDLLWAKIGVLLEVSIWLALTFNLAGLLVGSFSKHGSLWFAPVHLVSTLLSALFCTGSVVLIYQLCLRWFGRERLDGLMTTAQVLVGIFAVMGGQLMPQLMGRFGDRLNISSDAWWVFFLPPAWFAGLDDALAGEGTRSGWGLAAMGIAATAVVLWLAFGRLAKDYQRGLQMLQEAGPSRRPSATRGSNWSDRVLGWPLIRGWVGDPVTRASFKLTLAYLARDRDTKLRFYPGVAPMLVLPVVLLLPQRASGGHDFAVFFTGSYLAIIPMTALQLLTYSQQWQASDVFHSAPIPGPAAICHGARKAVLVWVALPVIVIFSGITLLMGTPARNLVFLLPGLILLPLLTLLPCVKGRAVPLSMPPEEAKAASRGLSLVVAMFMAMGVSGIALWMSELGWLYGFLLVELALAVPLYFVMLRSANAARWNSVE